MNHPGFLRSQESWAAQQTQRMPQKVASEMLAQRKRLIGTVVPSSTSPFAVANRFLVDSKRKLVAARVWDAYDESMIRDCAESWARAASAIPQLAAREEFARWHGVEPPQRRHLSDRYEACAARMADPRWWRRQLRKAWTRSSENAVRELGVVRKGKMPYASDDAVAYRRQMQRNARSFKEGAVLDNELGESIDLLEVAEKSVSNPILRRGEFMTRVRGFEELADSRRDVALFFSLTTPSRFHCQLSDGGPNPAYFVEETEKRKRETVRSSQAWLCKQWSKARAALHRRGIMIYGFRVAEPHHDATAHWHALFFVRSRDADTVSEVISKVWLKDAPDEPGARKHRVQCTRIDKARGSAAGYIAKYISKNIDGQGSIGQAADGETDQTVNEGVARVDAWAAVHGIRQFQQIGGPPVGLWRETRRLREEVDDVDIERIRSCADRGDWRGFCRAICYRMEEREWVVRYWKEQTGEKNRYGECRPARTLGLRCSSRTVTTRPHRWEIHRKGHAGRSGNTGTPAVDIAVTAGPDVGASRDSSSGSPSSPHLGPVAITVRLMPMTRRQVNGRWCQFTIPDRPGLPRMVYIDGPDAPDYVKLDPGLLKNETLGCRKARQQAAPEPPVLSAASNSPDRGGEEEISIAQVFSYLLTRELNAMTAPGG